MIFIDSGAFLAKYLKRDQHHPEAMAAWDGIQSNQALCATSNFVIDEVATLLARRAGADFAAKRIETIYDSPSFEILRPDMLDERKALGFLAKFSDQNVSFTDCVSFTLMRKRGIKTAFTFDGHFHLAGFDVIPA